jgi:cell division protein FtsB
MLQFPTPTPVAQGAPITEREFSRLHGQRSELQSQLKTLSRRRNELLEQRAVLQGDKSDHDARIKSIDVRSSQIDREIMGLDVAIAKGQSQPFVEEAPRGAAPRAVANNAAPQGTPGLLLPPPGISSDAERAIILSGLAFSAVAIYAIFLAARRFFAKPGPTSIESQARRLETLQQSVDVIALEVERMSESQRFVAKVLSEKFPALGVGEAQPVTAKAKDSAKA